MTNNSLSLIILANRTREFRARPSYVVSYVSDGPASSVCRGGHQVGKYPSARRTRPIVPPKDAQSPTILKGQES